MVRHIATDLRPGVLDHLGLVAAIEWQAQEVARRADFDCELLLGDPELDLDPDLETAVFRIFQETLTNVARHAGATKVCVSLEARSDELVLIVQDNGRGITKEQTSAPQSLGLIGMQERARSWGGDVTFQATAGQGTTVTVHVPREGKGEGR
jgi:signal transduction histidine kinase